MERKIFRKKLLILLMIISIVVADFFILGSNLLTYSSSVANETNNPNVEFLAYFKNEKEEKVDSIEKSIKSENLKLYAKISVKNEGYLHAGTMIEIENSNFNLKNNILSPHISSINGNKVTLKQINAGENVEIPLDIEPIILDKMSEDFLSKITTVKLNGSYTGSKEGGIQYGKEVCIDFVADETAKAELVTDIITNKVLSINGENKRVVQVLVKSRLTENQYPMQETKLNVTIPKLGEEKPEVNVMAIGTLATNSKKELGENSYTVNDKTVEVIINNTPDENNEISWNKNVYDEIVVTYIYPENVDASKIEITTNSKVQTYNSKNSYTATDTKEIENQEPNSVIMAKTEITTEELYKGKLYANKDEQYNTKTTIVVTNKDVADTIKAYEKADVLEAEQSEITANSKYVKTEINLDEMLKILGQDGNIEIKSGETTTVINKDSEVDKNGNVVINHESGVTKLEIMTSKPESTGILEINHTKVITGGAHTRAELRKVRTLKTQNAVEGKVGDARVAENIAEPATLELKETVSKAELTLDKTTLSAIEKNEVTVGIKLITDGTQYDLYKNPTITLQMPKAVENVEFLTTPSKIEADGFETITQNYNKANNTVTVAIKGEQTSYPKTSVQQTYIQLKLNVTLKQFALSEMDKITMQYTNENAIQYENGTTYGIVEKNVEISSPNELVTMFNINSNANTSLTEPLIQQIKSKDAGKTVDFEISLINNEDSDISDLKILGKLPTVENTVSKQSKNTLETKLTNIAAEDAQIYYTENTSATVDTANAKNGWTQDLSTLTNAKLYLIEVDSLTRGDKYTANLKVKMPNAITESAISYAQYGAIYDTETKTEAKTLSRKVGLVSASATNINVETTAKVGADILKDEGTVKEGEVIRYTVTVKNNGRETLENVQLKLDVPEGTTYVRPIPEIKDENGKVIQESYVYTPNAYYEEITESKKLEELTNIVIPKLSATTPYVIEYEVRVNKGSANSEISNNTTAIYNESLVKGNEIKNTIQESNVRVTVKRALDESRPLFYRGEARYTVYVENLSDSTINNLELQILSKGFNIENVNDNEEISDTIMINEITPKDPSDSTDKGQISEETNGIKAFVIYGSADENSKELEISAIVKDANKNTYKSNYLKEKILSLDATIDMDSPQDGKYIKEGDKVEYNITVKNTGDIECQIRIDDLVNDVLEIQEIYANNKLIMKNTDEMTISNNVEHLINLKPEEQVKLDIIANVGHVDDIYDGKTITNIASIDVQSVKELNSQMVTHILKADLQQGEDMKNIISGSVWLDANENGKRDSREEVASDIVVKLYDISTQDYARDKNDDIIQTIVDFRGEYSFSKVKNGSYLVLFEYDTEKYEPTKLLAEGVDKTLNSKASIKYITLDGKRERVTEIEIKNLKNNVFGMNLGLKENTGYWQVEDDQKEPGNPNVPDEPNEPGDPNTPQEKQQISGIAWLDKNRNGQMDENEKTLDGIRVRIYDVSIRNYLKNENGNIIETTTDKNGKYIFENIKKGSYIILFQYDTSKYEPTTYLAEGVSESRNSNAIINKINIDGQEIEIAVTDTINVQKNVYNINIGLREKLLFDLELNKYISKIVVQTPKETKTYNYSDSEFQKVEIHRKQINGSLVVLEYTIKVKNTGEIAGYVKNIVDYLPNGLNFSSELNKDWYISNNNLYTKCLEETELKPGEEKEIKLILTKTMTNENLGLINNRAEIYKDYNKFGETDIDSTPNNQAQNEDDLGTADVIVQVATGESTISYIILVMINIVLVFVAIVIMIRNNIIQIEIKRERR